MLSIKIMKTNLPIMEGKCSLKQLRQTLLEGLNRWGRLRAIIPFCKKGSERMMAKKKTSKRQLRRRQLESMVNKWWMQMLDHLLILSLMRSLERIRYQPSKSSKVKLYNLRQQVYRSKLLRTTNSSKPKTCRFRRQPNLLWSKCSTCSSRS